MNNFLSLLVSCAIFLHESGNVKANREVRFTRSLKNIDFNDKKITEEIFTSYELKSKLQCISLCRETTKCLSVSYNTITQTCVLFDKDFTYVGATAYDVEAGWQYFYLIREQPTRNHPLLSDTCETYSGGELVKIDRGLKQYCVRFFLANRNNGEVLIQGKKDETLNVWKFNDGTEMTYFNWYSGQSPPVQPQNNPGEIYLGVSKDNSYYWFDLEDAQFKAAVCQQT